MSEAIQDRASELGVLNKFKNKSGKWITRGLFREAWITGYDMSFVLYTLHDHDITVDGRTYPSLYRLYLEMEDLTEWEFAHAYFDGWEHWQLVAASSWFKDYLARYRTELELKLKSKAIKVIREEAELGGRNQYQANLFLINKGWIPKETEPSRRGRPSKSEIQRLAAEEAFKDKQIDDDYNRLNKTN